MNNTSTNKYEVITGTVTPVMMNYHDNSEIDNSMFDGSSMVNLGKVVLPSLENNQMLHD